MRKKFFSALLLITLAVPLTGALVSCSDYDDDISSLRDDVTSLKSQLETTKSDLEAELTSIKGDFAAQIQAAVEGKADKSEVEALNEALDAAESRLQTQIDAINEAIAGLGSGNIDDALATLAAITGDVNDLKTDVSGLDKRVEAVETNLELQQATLDAFMEAIKNGGYANADELIQAIKDAKSGIESIQSKLDGYSGDIEELKTFMEEAKETLQRFETFEGNLQGQIDALRVLVDNMLSGLVFAPDFYYGGIEAMEATSIEYAPIVLANNSTLEEPTTTGEGYSQLKITSYLTPDVIAKYHMNPSYFDVKKIKSMRVVSDDKEYVQLGDTRAAASLPSVVDGSWLNSKDGMLNAQINLDASQVKNDLEHVTVLAVQACFNGEDGKDSVVTSDYAAVAKSTINNIVIADQQKDGTSCLMEKFHMYTTAKAAIDNPYTHEIVYNDPEGVDLMKLVQAHFNRNGGPEQAMEDVSKYGMKWKFAVSHYIAGGNKTSESAHIYLKDNHAIACTVDASGKPQPGSQDRSSLDRLPLVRVTLVDTTKTTQNIVAIGFIKFKIAEKAAEPADAINIDFNGTGYDLSCEDYNYTLTWAEIEDKVLGELNLSKTEFENLYIVDEVSTGICQLYEKNEQGLPVEATQYGTVTEVKDAGGHMTNVLSWTVTAAEVYRAVWDATKSAYKTGVNLETGIKFERKDADPTKPAVYVWFHTGTITTPTAALENSTKIKENWAATNGTMGSGFDEIHNNVEVYGQVGANDEFINDILSTFVGNKITLNTTGSGAFASDKLTYDFRFVINDAYKTQTGLSGKVYTLSVSSDGYTLYAAPAAGLPEKVAVLNGSVVEYQKTTAAKDLLNAASHNNLAKTVTATVGIYAENGCDMELPIAGNMFDMKFLRPIDVVGADDVTFTDAIDHGNTKDVAELVEFTDWRDQWLEAYIGYYGVIAITADLDDITTTLNGGTLGKTLLSDVNPKLVFKQTGVGTEGEYGNVMFGQLLYENNGQVTGTFKVRVPLTVTYDWGEVKTYVDITIENTKANKVARR